MSSDPITMGPPGVYFAPPRAHRTLAGVPMDACGFVGVAPRGPAWVPVSDGRWTERHAALDPARPRARSVAVRVESMAEYHRHFGGFEGPGRLPYAVRAFFAQGGRTAWIVRIVPALGGGDAGAAWHSVPGLSDGSLNPDGTPAPARLRARNEGAWGAAITARFTWRVHPVQLIGAADATRLIVAPDEPLPAGSLLRVRLPDDSRVLRWTLEAPPETDASRSIRFDPPLPDVPIEVERVEVDVVVEDGDGRRESWAELGLDPAHPQWLGRVLDTESTLIFADAQWFDRRLTPSDLVELRSTLDSPGGDRYSDHQLSDTFASPTRDADQPGAGVQALLAVPTVTWPGGARYSDHQLSDTFASPTWDADQPGAGVQALLAVPTVASVVVPDLYVPRPLPAVNDVSVEPGFAGPVFAPCIEAPGVDGPPLDPPPLEHLHLDPQLPADRIRIIKLQQRLVDFATRARIVALLDVPPGLAPRDVLSWRRHFRSAFAAAYHGWLAMPVSDDAREGLVRVNPSAVGAGIIAWRELQHGIAWGPANAVVADAVRVGEQLDFAWHGRLHHDGVNVFASTPDGLRLTGARTLSPRRAWRQLSVRRLMTMLARTIERQMQWLAFEPNTSATRATVSRMLRGLLRDLYRANTFRGATEEEAFFVRCDTVLNTEYVIDSGRFIAEVGVAPAEPSEFIVVRLERDPGAELRVEA